LQNCGEVVPCGDIVDVLEDIAAAIALDQEIVNLASGIRRVVAPVGDEDPAHRPPPMSHSPSSAAPERSGSVSSRLWFGYERRSIIVAAPILSTPFESCQGLTMHIMLGSPRIVKTTRLRFPRMRQLAQRVRGGFANDSLPTPVFAH